MINFVKQRYIFLVISTTTILVAIGLIVGLGLKPGIDFAGGAVIELQSAKLVSADYHSVLSNQFDSAGSEVVSLTVGNDDQLMIKAKPIESAKWEEAKTALSQEYDDLVELSFENVGPVLGQELLQKTITAVIVAALMLMIYIGWRFKDRKFGVSAIIAMFHDVLVILASFAVFGYIWGVEVDIMFVTATLTALAFSVHDTVVLYDRVRESLRRNPEQDFHYVLNLAINETLVRSLSTSLSLFFVLTALLLLGGETIRWFIAALLVGTISGAYSSPFTAAPILAVWHEGFGNDKVKGKSVKAQV